MNKTEPKFYAEVQDGKLKFADKDAFLIWLGSLENQEVEVIVRKAGNKRTEAQNNALHLYFTQLSEAFNEAGLDIRKVIRQEVDIEWSPVLVKELLWRKIQKFVLKKESTTELNKLEEIDKIYELLNRFTSKFGVAVPFPSIEQFKAN